jgi:PD-(D/E)XK nuclease superfamily protein
MSTTGPSCSRCLDRSFDATEGPDPILGYGFLEKVYQRAMQVELKARGVKADLESEITVT